MHFKFPNTSAFRFDRYSSSLLSTLPFFIIWKGIGESEGSWFVAYARVRHTVYRNEIYSLSFLRSSSTKKGAVSFSIFIWNNGFIVYSRQNYLEISSSWCIGWRGMLSWETVVSSLSSARNFMSIKWSQISERKSFEGWRIWSLILGYL